MKFLFGTDGIREVVNEKLTVDLAMKLGNALANLFGSEYKKLYIARDTRNSGKVLEMALASGALVGGMNVESCGVLTTPGLAFITKIEKSIGVVISASHNPPMYNGLKVFCEGFKISDETEEKLEEIILKGLLKYSDYRDIGRYIEDSSKKEYVDYVVSLYKKNLQCNDLKIAVDVANGAAGAIINDIFGELNLNYTVYQNAPDGFNINENCGSTSHQTLSKIVKEEKYDFGILFDGDADRCLFIDRFGNLVDGDVLMAINALKLKAQERLKNKIVVSTIMSNLGLEEYLKKNEIHLIRTDVGDKYVLEKMLQENATIGGEQSGHIIFLDRSTTGDGIITALETLETLKYFSKSLDNFLQEIPKYPQHLENVTVKDKVKIMKDSRIENLIRKYESIEGFRIVVRPSGTEPKIRIMTEGSNEETIKTCVTEFSQLIQSIDNE
ncbi:phosphoglucosamine mutase [Petrotoga sp. 9T1HF07.CasAA.8.2]|uniref:phosphoglucosamine mutase n=1 Tax=unclassified Petrotoga TaxID=2620614 RepID=UPI000CC62916|nr:MULTISPECIES: phosphoglucosamine mutase [unclassified Petrotoga]MBL5981318.1 phosphoglucosamine mutase [Petrotoga sp. 8T1HF07.NaAc.6.1]PNR89249.1 phosphoglucosamine mutase [Petrotoga sp. 9T1HF07.CasAA.8.2]